VEEEEERSEEDVTVVIGLPTNLTNRDRRVRIRRDLLKREVGVRGIEVEATVEAVAPPRRRRGREDREVGDLDWRKGGVRRGFGCCVMEGMVFILPDV